MWLQNQVTAVYGRDDDDTNNNSRTFSTGGGGTVSSRLRRTEASRLAANLSSYLTGNARNRNASSSSSTGTHRRRRISSSSSTAYNYYGLPSILSGSNNLHTLDSVYRNRGQCGCQNIQVSSDSQQGND